MGFDPSFQATKPVVQQLRGTKTGTQQQRSLQRRNEVQGELLGLVRTRAKQAKLSFGPGKIGVKELSCSLCLWTVIFIKLLTQAPIGTAIPNQIVAIRSFLRYQCQQALSRIRQLLPLRKQCLQFLLTGLNDSS